MVSEKIALAHLFFFDSKLRAFFCYGGIKIYLHSKNAQPLRRQHVPDGAKTAYRYVFIHGFTDKPDNRRFNPMISYNISDEVLTVFIKGELDHHTASGLKEETDGLIDKFSPIKTVLDFKNVTFCDSSGIAFVLGRYKHMTSKEGILELTRLPRQVAMIFELANIGSLIRIT